MYFSSAFNFFLDTTCYQSMSANIIPSLCYHLVTNKQEINDCALLNIYWQQSHSCKSLSAFILHHVDNGATFVIFQQLWHVLAPFLYQGILLYSNTGTEFIHWFTKVKDGPLSQWQSSYTSVKQHNVSGYGRLFNWMFGNKCIGWYDMKRVMLIELFYVVKRHCVICKLDDVTLSAGAGRHKTTLILNHTCTRYVTRWQMEGCFANLISILSKHSTSI